MGETNVLFSIGPLEVTGAVVTMWVIVAVLALLSWLATRRLRDVPGPLQNAAEMAVEKLQGFYGGILGPANARRYFPMMATFFIFIVVSNYIGLLPGAGERCVRALAARCAGPEVRLTCAAENERAMRLYDRLGFSRGAEERVWFSI